MTATRCSAYELSVAHPASCSPHAISAELRVSIARRIRGVVGVRRRLQKDARTEFDAGLLRFELDEGVLDRDRLAVVFLVGPPLHGAHHAVLASERIDPFHAEEVVVALREHRQRRSLAAFLDDLRDRAAGRVSVFVLHRARRVDHLVGDVDGQTVGALRDGSVRLRRKRACGDEDRRDHHGEHRDEAHQVRTRERVHAALHETARRPLAGNRLHGSGLLRCGGRFRPSRCTRRSFLRLRGGLDGRRLRRRRLGPCGLRRRRLGLCNRLPAAFRRRRAARLPLRAHRVFPARGAAPSTRSRTRPSTASIRLSSSPKSKYFTGTDNLDVWAT